MQSIIVLMMPSGFYHATLSGTKEPALERKAVLLKRTLIVQDADFTRLVDSDERDIIVCTPIQTPAGTRRGVFVFVEGATVKHIEHNGRSFRLVAVVRSKQTKRTDPVRRKVTVEVALTGIGEIPPGGVPPSKVVHWP